MVIMIIAPNCRARKGGKRRREVNGDYFQNFNSLNYFILDFTVVLYYYYVKLHYNQYDSTAYQLTACLNQLIS